MEDKKQCADFRRYVIQLYSGMFAGLVFLACIAGCVGLASNVVELSGFLFASLAAAAVFFVAQQV